MAYEYSILVEQLSDWLREETGLRDAASRQSIAEEAIWSAEREAGRQRELEQEHGDYDPRSEALTAAARNEGRI